MPSLPDLPTELRQQILLLVLPDTNRIDLPWSTQISSLSRVNKSVLLDLATVIGTWSPLHYISFPASIRNLQPRALNLNGRTYTPKLERICLDLFYASDVNRIRGLCYCSWPASWTHPELIEAWAAAVSDLPDCAKDIWLDVTPAPGTKRDQHRLVLNQFVHDRRASQKFLSGHVHDVAALVRRVDQHYCGRARIALTGTLSTKSKLFVDLLSVWAERELDYAGRWVSSDEARFASLSEAVQRMTSRKVAWQGKRRGDRHPMMWLGDVVWDRRTVFLFARLVNEGREMEAVGDVKKIAEFRDGQGRLVMGPVESLRRAFQHCVAADLGFSTVGEGEGAERHVVVR